MRNTHHRNCVSWLTRARLGLPLGLGYAGLEYGRIRYVASGVARGGGVDSRIGA